MKDNYDELLSMFSYGIEMEKKIANGNIKLLHVAMKNDCRDIKVLAYSLINRDLHE